MTKETKKPEKKIWEVVINFTTPEDAAPLSPEQGERVIALFETVNPPPFKCRLGTPGTDEPALSALFTGIQGNTSFDAQIRADNLLKQAVNAVEGLPLVLDSSGVRQQNPEQTKQPEE